jgi:hypothetical protein
VATRLRAEHASGRPRALWRQVDATTTTARPDAG